MGLVQNKVPEISVCDSDRFGRILKPDHSGRILGSGRRSVLPFRWVQGVRRVSVLSELKVGTSGILVSLDLPESVQNHLMHMGFVPDALVTALRRAPAGDPTVYLIDGMEIALRHETAESIRVRPPELEADAGDPLHAPAHLPAFVADEELVEAAR
jgi:Fe2+ transport system protein FeoA